MTGRIPARVARLGVALLTVTAVLAVTAGAAGAASTVIYNNTPSPKPGNLPSWGFQATQTSEFGGQVEVEAGTWKNPTLIVMMSSWGCQEGTWNGNDCKTAPGAKFEWPITFNIYQVGPGNSVGAKIATGSKVFKMPYRPSASAKCTGPDAGKWFMMGTCYNGRAFKISLGLKIANLPQKVIVSVAYDTTSYGAEPQGTQPCSSTVEGCPYDSLNVAVREAGEGPPAVGSDPFPDSVYVNSTTAGNYCSNPGAVGTFGISEGCWTEEQPAIEIKGH
jgi:hypothetical protein